MENAPNDPCVQCPFLRTAAPGYLGASFPEEFAHTTIDREEDMPCHMSVDYDEDGDWKENLHKSKRCRGSLIFLRNNCKLPHNSELAASVQETPVNRSLVFSNRQEFLDHHNNRSWLEPEKQKTKVTPETTLNNDYTLTVCVRQARKSPGFGNFFLTDSWRLIVSMYEEPHAETMRKLHLTNTDVLLSGSITENGLSFRSTRYMDDDPETAGVLINTIKIKISIMIKTKVIRLKSKPKS